MKCFVDTGQMICRLDIQLMNHLSSAVVYSNTVFPSNVSNNREVRTLEHFYHHEKHLDGSALNVSCVYIKKYITPLRTM